MPAYPEPARVRRQSRSSTARPSPTRTAGWRTATTPTPGRWTERQNALTEAYLAAVPGRDAIRGRLDELLAIGALGVPDPVRGPLLLLSGGTDGRTSRCSTVREGVDGEDRRGRRSQRARRRRHHRAGLVLPERGRPAAGLRAVRERQRAERAPRARRGGRRAPARPDPPDARGRPGLAARRHGLLLHPLSRAGRGARRRGALPPRGLLPSRWAPIPRTIRWSSSPREKEYWPGVEPLPRRPLAARSASPAPSIRPISTCRTCGRPDRAAWSPVAENLPASFEGEVVRGRLFLRTNLDAPTYRLYAGGPRASRAGRTGGRSSRHGRTRCSRARVSPVTGWR